jgi:hypothetical protein
MLFDLYALSQLMKRRACASTGVDSTGAKLEVE